MSSAATYIGRDDATQGNWIGQYGQDGYQVPSSASFSGAFLPAYISDFSVSGPGDFTYEQFSANAYGLLRPDDQPEGWPGTRYAGVWTGPEGGGFDVAFTTAQACRVAVYCWDPNDYRTQRLSILDDSDAVLVGPIEFTGFAGGSWFVFDLSAGSYKVRPSLVNLEAFNDVLSGLFWGPQPTPTPDPLTVSLASSAITSTTATVTSTSEGGTGEIVYAWTKDGAAIAGETGAVLELTGLTPSTSYAISVTATDSASATATGSTTVTTAAAPPSRVIRVEPYHAVILSTGVNPHACIILPAVD